MSTTIDSDHMLVDLATLREIEGATEIDTDGTVSGKLKDHNSELKPYTRHLPHGSWRIVRRRG